MKLARERFTCHVIKLFTLSLSQLYFVFVYTSSACSVQCFLFCNSIFPTIDSHRKGICVNMVLNFHPFSMNYARSPMYTNSRYLSHFDICIPGFVLSSRQDAVLTACICEDSAIMAALHIGSRPSDHYFRSVCLSVCLCRVFLSRLWSDFDQTRIHVICLGLVVSPRI